MKLRIILTTWIILALAACGSFEVSIEPAPEATRSPNVIVTSETSATGTLSQPQPTIIPATATEASPEGTQTPKMVQIFLIALEDQGQTGKLIGCGDSVIPVQVQIPPTQGVLRAALEALLSLKTQYYGESGLYNALYQSDLQVESVTIKDRQAVVKLTGTLSMGGECDSPRVAAQLEETVLQFSTVSEASIFVNDRPLADVLSLRG